jgi:pilus assembly protein Flp/PilA
MNDARLPLSALVADESGQDLIEYALVAGLLGLAAVAAMTNIASSVSTVFTSAGTTLTTNV